MEKQKEKEKQSERLRAKPPSTITTAKLQNKPEKKRGKKIGFLTYNKLVGESDNGHTSDWIHYYISLHCRSAATPRRDERIARKV